VAVLALEPEVEKVFHDDSYGYRPGRSPLDAIAACRKRCWEKDWVVDLDVKAFFDTVSWDLTMKAVTRHTDRKWVLLYVERWLKAPMQMPDGTAIDRTRGTPQGGPISPLLANLFLHYGFDLWISRKYPGVRFERFADDAVIHCVTERQAWEVREAIGRRFADLANGGPRIDAVLSFFWLNDLLGSIGIDARMSRLVAAIAGENIATGFAGAAFVAYLSSLASKLHGAVQFAVFTSLTLLVGTLGRGALGDLIKSGCPSDQPSCPAGYVGMFELAAALGLISIFFVSLEWYRQYRQEQATAAATGS